MIQSVSHYITVLGAHFPGAAAGFRGCRGGGGGMDVCEVCASR